MNAGVRRVGVRIAGIAGVAALVAAAPVAAPGAPVHAAYFYQYMPLDHVDSLAAAGFDRAVIRCITDSLGSAGATRVAAFVQRGALRHVDIAPEWALQAPTRLAALPTTRRYTWSQRGADVREATVGCPLDSLFWRSVLLDRADEFLAASPGVHRLVLDLEIYGGGRHHYDAGPCRCASCLRDYLHGADPGPITASDLRGLAGWEEARLGALLTHLLAEFAQRHPGVELGAFDLDFDSFVHRAFCRALAKDSIPTADYTERTYDMGGGPLPFVRTRLAALGLGNTPVYGGIWLKRWSPQALPSAAHSVLSGADGWFVFTTYSLWLDPTKLAGPYTLQGTPAAYWAALKQANAPLGAAR